MHEGISLSTSYLLMLHKLNLKSVDRHTHTITQRYNVHTVRKQLASFKTSVNRSSNIKAFRHKGFFSEDVLNFSLSGSFSRVDPETVYFTFHRFVASHDS